MHENDVTAEKLAADLRLVISDAEALLRAKGAIELELDRRPAMSSRAARAAAAIWG